MTTVSGEPPDRWTVPEPAAHAAPTGEFERTFDAIAYRVEVFDDGTVTVPGFVDEVGLAGLVGRTPPAVLVNFCWAATALGRAGLPWSAKVLAMAWSDFADPNPQFGLKVDFEDPSSIRDLFPSLVSGDRIDHAAAVLMSDWAALWPRAFRSMHEAPSSRRVASLEDEEFPAVLLARLVFDDDDQVRQAVAAHRNTPAEALRVLARDARSSVRREVVRLRINDPQLLAHLAETDPDATVRAHARRRLVQVSGATRGSGDPGDGEGE